MLQELDQGANPYKRTNSQISNENSKQKQINERKQNVDDAQIKKYDDIMRDSIYMKLVSGKKQNENVFNKEQIVPSLNLQNAQQTFSQSEYIKHTQNGNMHYKNGKNSKQFSNTLEQPTDKQHLSYSANKYDQVKNIYGQEIQILKSSIKQCQQNDQQTKQQFEVEEERLMQSFSNSPSPDRDQLRMREYKQNDMINSQKLNTQSQNNSNILENDAYHNYVRNTKINNEQSRSGFIHKNSSSIQAKSYQSPSLLKAQNHQSSSKYGRNQDDEQLQRTLQLNKSPLDEEMERLRQENEILKQNIQKTMQNKYQHNRTSSQFINNKTGQTPVNPYTQNLYNSAQKDKQMYPTISPQSDKRFQQESSVLQSYDQNMSQSSHYGENQREQNHDCCYQKLSYYDQVMKNREIRKKEQENQQEIIQQRNNYQDNILRQNKSSKYNTPQKSNQKRMRSNKSGRMSQASQQKYVKLSQDYQIEYDNYTRKVSKYDIDRGNVDFQALKKQKEKDRTQNVLIKKEVIDHETLDKRVNEIKQTDNRINELSELRKQQEKERKEMVRRNDEALRRVIEERKSIQVQYLSPNIRMSSRKQSVSRRNNDL